MRLFIQYNFQLEMITFLQMNFRKTGIGSKFPFHINDIHHARQKVSIAARPDLMYNYSGM